MPRPKSAHSRQAPFPATDAPPAVTGEAPPPHSPALLELERDLALALARCDDPRACLQALLDHALRLPACECGGAYLFDEDSAVLRLVAHRGVSAEFVAAVALYPPDSPQVRQVHTGALCCAARHEFHPDIAARLASEGIQSLVVMPLCCGQRLIGALNLASRSLPEYPPAVRAEMRHIAEFAGKLLDAMHAQREHLGRLIGERTRELAAANAQLTAQAATLHLALEASDAGIREIDLLTGEIFFDPRGRALAGYTDVNGSISVEQALHERVHHPSREQVRRMLETLAQPSAPNHWEHEFMINHPTRGLRWIAGRGKVFRDETGKPVRLLGIIFDITERRRAEEVLRDWKSALELQVAERTRELRESEHRFRVMAEAAFEGIVISSESIVLDVNEQAAAMFGYLPAEVIGRPTSAFVAPESIATVVEHLRTTPGEPLHWQGLRKDGSLVPVMSRTRIEQRQDREIRLTAIRDLTAELESQAHLESLRAELDRAAGLALISEISQSIVHQLSQPLTVAGNHIEIALARMGRCAKGDCSATDVIAAMKGELRQVREVVVHLRSLVDPQQVERRPTSLNLVVTELLPLLRREGGAARVAIRTSLAPDLPDIHANAIQLKQVLINLVRNAVEACASSPPPGGGSVRITTRILPDQHLELVVRDNGPGFAPGIAERLLTPFVTSKPGGTGIGLRLCRRIINAHQGTIEGIPNPGGPGVSFVIRLPLTAPPHDPMG